jgi:hypothetical protein
LENYKRDSVKFAETQERSYQTEAKSHFVPKKGFVPAESFHTKMKVNNIPEDPHVSRQNVMQTVSMVKNKFVQSNPHSREFISEQNRMAKTLRENMGVTNFNLGHIAPEHRKL